jgi:hypothetical protein
VLDIRTLYHVAHQQGCDFIARKQSGRMYGLSVACRLICNVNVVAAAWRRVVQATPAEQKGLQEVQNTNFNVCDTSRVASRMFTYFTSPPFDFSPNSGI